MKYPISLTIFFPAYNEEKNIVKAVNQAVEVAQDSPFIGNYEILVINDGSSDCTRELAEAIAATNPHVKVINHPTNRGYGSALKTGLSAAVMDYVFFTDSDRQFDMLELHSLLVQLPQFEVVIGYRSPRRDPLMRLLNAKGWNLLNRALFGLSVRDIDCAFKIFKRDVVQSLKLRSRGAMINAEILIKLKRKGVALKEVPVSHLPRVAGSPTGAKPSVILRALREIVSLYGGELGSVTHKQALKFMSVGVVNTLVDAVAYIALTRGVPVFAEHLVAAKFFSFLLGTISSLMLNRYWTFGLRTPLTWGEVVRFYTTTSISLVINVEAMNILVSLGMYDLLALLVTTGFTFVASFTLAKFWVFKNAPEPKPKQA
jgi:glycosyltransferase involved in cell wall biosynthesis